ncbi:MAG: hypothetical protein Q9181_001848 [Wetmoreana brouardii]
METSSSYRISTVKGPHLQHLDALSCNTRVSISKHLKSTLEYFEQAHLICIRVQGQLSASTSYPFSQPLKYLYISTTNLNMASSPLQQVEYTSNKSAQSNFQSQYDLQDPTNAMTAYMKSLHQYTKLQMESATRSSKRRTDAAGVSQMATLTPGSSTGRGPIDSYRRDDRGT